MESSGRALIYAAVVGVVAGLGGAGFYAGLKAVQGFVLGDYLGHHEPAAGNETQARVTLPPAWWKVILVPTVGGLLCGLLVFTLAPEAEGHGTDARVRSFGGSGGVFAPSLFIGAMLGGAFGLAARQVLEPEWVPQPAAYVLVGMGGFFAGVANVPLTSLIMVSEMSGSYGLLMPLMLVSTFNVAVLSSCWKLNEEQVASLVDSPAHLADFVVDVLAGLRVRDVYAPGTPQAIQHLETFVVFQADAR